MEELSPFTGDFMYDMVPVVDDDDLKKHGHFSNESLIKKYREAKERVMKAHPPKDEVKKVSHDLKDYIQKRDEDFLDFSNFAQ